MSMKTLTCKGVHPVNPIVEAIDSDQVLRFKNGKCMYVMYVASQPRIGAPLEKALIFVFIMVSWSFGGHTFFNLGL